MIRGGRITMAVHAVIVVVGAAPYSRWERGGRIRAASTSGGRLPACGLRAAALAEAGAGFFFFGSGFLPAMDVTYGSRGGEGSQGQPDESGDLARCPVKERLERFG